MPTTPPPTKPVAPSEDFAQLDFAILRTRFDASACEREAFTLATHMFAKDYTQAMALLPVNFDPARQATATAGTMAVNPHALDFNRDGVTTSHEWAAALVAAKKLKLTSSEALPVENVDGVVNKASEIYRATRAADTQCRPL